MFSFNFDLEGDGGATPASTATKMNDSGDNTPMRPGERFVYTPSPTSAAFSGVQVGDMAFEIVNTTDSGFLARTGAISSILTTSDVQTGVYEGGFKLWECAVDLVKFVETQLRQQPNAKMPAAVLELGCGHGLPGIHALQRGAERVVFMDYNKEVLELTTCPNVLRNVHGDENLYAKASFYAGAWTSVTQYMEKVEQQPPEQMQFDLVLTAETIYTEPVAIELYQTIKRHLRRAPNSRALVAAKKYYFGTNGSVQHFVSLVEADGIFRAEIVWEERDCRSNIREIVQLTYAA
ncbi:hypothetical protein BBJ29_007648 [Phytophthora kernoviae]|uniref:protein-histidine N-methyltransferase n=1 Tax=Phytophthora kernoviae TaxID=325452 RepID=A0A3F2RS71_9STRA|nr:hypothetical protein BBJ29_007648 [Phytophthora kernoviae]RLN63204.1 hypothetical protein BBP00_00004300 [Phytophthora kernoviae]